MKRFALSLTTGLLFAAAGAQADTTARHPAVRSAPATAPAAVLARDASPALVGHPASPRWQLARANHEHPAVAQARLAREPAAIDPNTFLVQPPASVHWTVAPAAAPLLAKAQ